MVNYDSSYRGRNHSFHNSNRQGNERPLPEIKFDEIKFYKDNNKVEMNNDIVDSIALQCAEAFEPTNKEKGIKSSQLRKFYAEVKSLELAWKQNNNFNAIGPRLKLIKAKVSYACNRKVVPKAFEKWLHACINKTNDEKDFIAFLLHFEAIVGFSYGLGLKD